MREPGEIIESQLVYFTLYHFESLRKSRQLDFLYFMIRMIAISTFHRTSFITVRHCSEPACLQTAAARPLYCL
jgi:phenylalanine-4-hydroxylase